MTTTSLTDQLRVDVATSCRVLASAGQGDLIWGHSSARDPHGRGVWLKAAEWGLDEVDRDRVHLVSPEGEVLEGEGTRHSEYPIHTEVMAARPDIGGVVHTHPPHAVALAATGQDLRPVSHAANLFVPPGVPRFTDTADLVLTNELGRSVSAVLGEARGVFLVNHGIVAVGPTVQQATVVAVVLEQACRQQILTQTAGGWPTWSPSEESLAKREHVYNERALSAVWDYLVRRLPRR
ncbi:class II aldolase/adducin family protein [Knoellia sp. Soil729]|uniref:class II aldolase/adducin family protein n=1 Tax=Knoellia sp. Soil729 TaxID=1736394 RepID=UPI0006F3321A|nr:class II aldolase/adducin family protein [Knoellia sp. Soil729]KRE40800.1 ribulose phosphate epimerase [Knoellia sp. Soil729]